MNIINPTLRNPEDVRVLIGCERSGVVRKSFEALGFDAYSCDIQPDAERSNRHFQCDINEVLDDDWDVLAVFHPPCFVGDTMVLTEHGYMQISDIQVGDKVLTHKGRWRSVTEVMSKKTKKTTVVKSSNSLPTITTPEHPYYSRLRAPYANNNRTLEQRDGPADFVNAGKLTAKHFTGSVLPEAHNINVSDDFLWLAGRYVADGHLRPSRYTNGKYECMILSIGNDKLKDCVQRLESFNPYVLPHGESVHRITFYKSEFASKFEQFGKGAANKILPAWVLSLTKKQAAVFLDGYLSGDGYVTDKRISASTISKQLVLGLSVLFQRVYETCPSIRMNQSRGDTVIEGRTVSTSDSYTIEIKTDCDRRVNYIDGNYAWGKVKSSITDTSEMVTVYNLSVEEDETYTANGVVVHNCTRLCNSGVRWLKVAPTKLDPDDYSADEVAMYDTLDEDGRLAFMWDQLDKGAAFFSKLWNAPIPHRAVENPILHKYAKERIVNFKPAQYVQPWWFGDPAFKATGFHTVNLPKLVPTDKLTPPKKGTPEHKAWSMIHNAPPGPERHNIRSQTFKGIGDAVAQQWGSHVVGHELEMVA